MGVALGIVGPVLVWLEATRGRIRRDRSQPPGVRPDARPNGRADGAPVTRSGPVGVQIAAFPRQALHARRLGFTHPVEERPLEFDSPLPADLRELAQSLERL